MMSQKEDDKSTARPGEPAAADKVADSKEDWIGAHLRRVYDEALSEPIPDRFLALLKEIDKKERGA